MKTANKTINYESFKTRTGYAGGLLTIIVLAAAFTALEGQVWGETPGVAKVVTYPAPAGEALSEGYEVNAAGQHVDSYTARVLDPPFAGKQ